MQLYKSDPRYRTPAELIKIGTYRLDPSYLEFDRTQFRGWNREIVLRYGHWSLDLIDFNRLFDDGDDNTIGSFIDQNQMEARLRDRDAYFYCDGVFEENILDEMCRHVPVVEMSAVLDMLDLDRQLVHGWIVKTTRDGNGDNEEDDIRAELIWKLNMRFNLLAYKTTVEHSTEVVVADHTRRSRNDDHYYFANSSTVRTLNFAACSTMYSFGNAGMFNCRNLVSVVLPPNLVVIGDHFLAHCVNLKHLIVPPTVSSIGSNFLGQCRSLTHFKAPIALTVIDDDFLRGCEGLSTVVLPPMVRKIGKCCMMFCSSLTRLDHPKSLISVGDRYLYGCSSLIEYVIPAKLDKGEFFLSNTPARIKYAE